jgi:caffeoyl-CoA O-methyltransferase
MTPKSESPWLDPTIARYVAARATPPDAVLADLARETVEATGDRAGMQISPDQGALLSLMTRLVGAKRAVEVGTFTGYSSICIARALAPGGTLLCCDVSEHWTSIARRAWERADLSDRIELRLAPALDTLTALPLDVPTDEMIDLAFIDADKGRYQAYYEELLVRLRPGGLICADNTLWSGAVTQRTDDADTLALQQFNDHVAADPRVESYILPVADGLTLIRKR